MKTTIISNAFENGKRVQTQKVSYEKSDDLFTLANLQRQYENIMDQISLAIQEGRATEYLTNERDRIADEIAAQEDNLDMYNTVE